jgi:hypothetical protein
VTSIGNNEPLARPAGDEEPGTSVIAPSTASMAVGAVKSTMAVSDPAAAFTAIFPGTVTRGASLSDTVTVKLAVPTLPLTLGGAELLAASIAV